MPALPILFTKPFFRYLLVGGTAFTFEYLVFFSLFSLLSVPLLLANSLSFICGLTLSFTLQRAWSFKKDQFDKSFQRQFIIFGSLALCNLVLTNVLLAFLTSLDLDPRLGKIAVMLAIVGWDFLLMKRVIFKQ